MILLADPKLAKVGCVLLQAAYGTDYRKFDFDLLFPSQLWFTAPTADMKLFDFRDLKQLVDTAEKMLEIHAAREAAKQ